MKHDECDGIIEPGVATAGEFNCNSKSNRVYACLFT